MFFRQSSKLKRQKESEIDLLGSQPGAMYIVDPKIEEERLRPLIQTIVREEISKARKDKLL